MMSMIIKNPQDNEIIQAHQQAITIELMNEDELQAIPLEIVDFQVQVKPHPESPPTREVHCNFIKSALEEAFWNALNEKRKRLLGLGPRSVKIAPKSSFSLTVSLSSKLMTEPYFKQNHQFVVTVTVKQQPRSFFLYWQPNPVSETVAPTPVIPLPPLSLRPLKKPPILTSKGGQTMLTYEGVKPFYLNSTTTNTLELHLTGADQKQWVELSSEATLRLTKGTTVNLNFNAPTAEPPLPTVLLEKINTAFTATVTKITVAKTAPKNPVLTLTYPKTDNLVLRRDTAVELTVLLTKTEEKGTAGTTPKIECIIPTIIQRPAFLGHAALDFGTTNSACAYYDPDKGAPIFPDRDLSPLQLQALQETLDRLMKVLEEKSLNEVRYKILETRLINFAQLMWATSQGGSVKSCDDIRRRFALLKQQGVTETELGKWRSKLLVSWGIHNYNQFRQQQPPEITQFLAHQYYQCLNRIIDIDLQADVKIFLPELEKGRKDGTISSAIVLEKLVADPTKAAEPYPGIQALTSKIKMGLAVETAMREAIPKNTQTTESTPHWTEACPETHQTFLTGTKRGIGQTECVCFVDKTGQKFKDTYNPICTAALKYLRALAEEFITDEGSKCLNDLVVTYPANLPQHRRLYLKAMVQSLGVRDLDLTFDEATAGALYYVWRELLTDKFAGIDGFLARSRARKYSRPSPVTGQMEEVTLYFQNILFYDMGGGTTDIALLEIGLEEVTGIVATTEQLPNLGRYFIVRPRVLGLTGKDNFAGDNVTLAVFRILKSKLATKVATMLTGNKSHLRKVERSPAVQQVLEAFEAFETAKPQPNSQESCFTQWFQIGNSKDYEKAKIRGPIDTLVPTQFRHKPELQPIFFDLWKEAERIKQTLSTTPPGYEGGDLPKSVTADGGRLLPAIQWLNLGLQEDDLSDIQVSAAEMERVVRQDIQSTFEQARNLCIGTTKSMPVVKHLIDRVILAGSSSHLRLIRAVMPQEILGQPFDYEGHDGRNWTLPAPFKLDNYNLMFDAKESKLAVVRGACLPRYFKTNRVDCRNPQLSGHLTRGITFIDFDIDNLRHYLPFSLAYTVGMGKEVLFLAGDRMNLKQRDGSVVARKFIAAQEIVRCYRIENVNQVNSADEEGLYCQFEIFQAIAKQAGLDKEADRTKITELGNQYKFFIEFDVERNLKCWMYPHLDGNTDREYIKQTAVLSEQIKPAAVMSMLGEEMAPGKWVWQSGLTLTCPLGLGGEEMVKFKPYSPNDAVVEGEVTLRQAADLSGGKTEFRAADNTLLWSVNLRNYQVKTPELAKLRIYLSFQKEGVVLKYTVYDPDLEDKTQLWEIPMSFDNRRKSLPFNPFGGDE